MVKDVYFLTLHPPYTAAEHAVPINATIVHASTLLHPLLPQPDAAMIYRCLTEFPNRTPGCLVPLSTLSFELDGGNLWHRIGDWERVSEAVAQLARLRRCDAMPLGLPEVSAALLSGGPSTTLKAYTPNGVSEFGPADRTRILAELTDHVHTNVAQDAFGRAMV